MWLAMNKLNYALHTQTLRVAIGLEGPYLLEHLLYAQRTTVTDLRATLCSAQLQFM